MRTTFKTTAYYVAFRYSIDSGESQTVADGFLQILAGEMSSYETAIMEVRPDHPEFEN